MSRASIMKTLFNYATVTTDIQKSLLEAASKIMNTNVISTAEEN